jgi:hypothetical protein
VDGWNASNVLVNPRTSQVKFGMNYTALAPSFANTTTNTTVIGGYLYGDGTATVGGTVGGYAIRMTACESAYFYNGSFEGFDTGLFVSGQYAAYNNFFGMRAEKSGPIAGGRNGTRAYIFDGTSTLNNIIWPLDGDVTNAIVNFQGGATGSVLLKEAPVMTQTLTGIAPTPNAALGETCLYTLTANSVMGAPVAPQKGQALEFLVTEGGAGGFTLGFNPVYKFSAAGFPSTAAGSKSSIRFRCDGVNWVQVGAAITGM